MFRLYIKSVAAICQLSVIQCMSVQGNAQPRSARKNED